MWGFIEAVMYLHVHVKYLNNFKDSFDGSDKVVNFYKIKDLKLWCLLSFSTQTTH